jgi:hypothetical protein
MDGIQVKLRIFPSFYYVCTYVILAGAPFASLLVSLPVDLRVEPAIINGLLTASSILFGIALLPIGKRKRDLLYDLMISIDVFIISMCGIVMFMFGIGSNNGLPPLILAASSLGANATTARYRLHIERYA